MTMVKKTYDEAALQLVMQWNPVMLLVHAKAHTIFDPEAIRLVFALAKERAAELLAADQTPKPIAAPAVEAQSVPVAMTDAEILELWASNPWSDKYGVIWPNKECLVVFSRALLARAAVQGRDGPAITADVHRDAERWKAIEDCLSSDELLDVAQTVAGEYKLPQREIFNKPVGDIIDAAIAARNANSGDTES